MEPTTVHLTSQPTGTRTSSTCIIHCACIPLLYSEEVVAKIQSLESFYEVKVTFTDRGLSPLEIAQAVTALGKQFGTRQIKDITVPVGVNERRYSTVTCSTTMPPSWYYSSGSATNRTRLSATDSSLLENFFQFGGTHVTLSGDEYIVDFSEKKLKSKKSGQIANVRRLPLFVDVPQQKVVIYISGQDSSVKNAQSALLEVLNGSLVETAPIPWSIEQKFSSNMEQQIKNFARQFCVLFDFTADQVSVCLKGAPDYVETVHEQMQKHIQALVQDFSAYRCSLSPLTKSLLSESPPSHTPLMSQLGAFQSGCPPLWESQCENCVFLNVASKSYEWNEVFGLMSATLPGVSLRKLERVQNISLWEKYSLEGKHMIERNKGTVNEKYLFHGTSKVDPYTVAKAECGIDFRFSMTNRSSLLWGSGSYFAVKFHYSNMFSYRLSNGERQVMLVSVLTGYSRPYRNRKEPHLTKPPFYGSGAVGSRLYDTVNGETGDSVVYVVYDHCKSCPAYIITYIPPT